MTLEIHYIVVIVALVLIVGLTLATIILGQIWGVLLKDIRRLEDERNLLAEEVIRLQRNRLEKA